VENVVVQIEELILVEFLFQATGLQTIFDAMTHVHVERTGARAAFLLLFIVHVVIQDIEIFVHQQIFRIKVLLITMVTHGGLLYLTSPNNLLIGEPGPGYRFPDVLSACISPDFPADKFFFISDDKWWWLEHLAVQQADLAGCCRAECDGDHAWPLDRKISHLSAGMPGPGFVKWRHRDNLFAWSLQSLFWRLPQGGLCSHPVTFAENLKRPYAYCWLAGQQRQKRQQRFTEAYSTLR
jgi:hypothetical protein